MSSGSALSGNMESLQLSICVATPLMILEACRKCVTWWMKAMRRPKLRRPSMPPRVTESWGTHPVSPSRMVAVTMMQ